MDGHEYKVTLRWPTIVLDVEEMSCWFQSRLPGGEAFDERERDAFLESMRRRASILAQHLEETNPPHADFSSEWWTETSNRLMVLSSIAHEAWNENDWLTAARAILALASLVPIVAEQLDLDIEAVDQREQDER